LGGKGKTIFPTLGAIPEIIATFAASQ
jgi:hypothetical protein